MFVFYLWQRGKEKIKIIAFPKEGQTVEVSLYLDKSARKSLEKAWLFCYRKGHRFLRPIHLFTFFLKEKRFKKVLARLDCRPEKVIKKTENILKNPSFFPGETKRNILGIEISSDFKKIFLNAYLFCLKRNKQQISSLDILWAVSQEEDLLGMIFDEFGISSREIEQAIEWSRLEERFKKEKREFFWRRLFKPKSKLNRALTATLTPLLDRVGRDLTRSVKEGRFEMIIGREKEIERIFNLFNAGRRGVILVGQSNIGKKSILKKLAQLMVEEKVPKFLQDKRLVLLDLANLVSLAEAREKGEEYLKKIFFEVNRAKNIVLAIENIDSLVGLRSRGGGLDFSEILASVLESQTFFFVGTSSPQAFSSKIEGEALGRTLTKIEVALPSKDMLWQILIAKVFIIEEELKILFSVDALAEAINLADRFIYGKTLLAKAVDLLVEAGYLVRSQRGSGALVEGKDIIELVSQKTEIPLGETGETEKKKLLEMEKLIHRRIINQKEAVRAVADALRRSRLSPRKRQKPICSFLFIGPTGVGKTETAKTLARIYFNDEKRMIRLDMSEYQEKRGLRRLIGSRTDEGIVKGYLTEAIKRQPYALLLLDEIEKAHPDILNLFLQLTDDGRLTDVSGETINFTNVIFIATSNAGTQFIQQKISRGVDYHEIYRELKEKVLLEYFRPEFLNRFDKIVVFRALTMENIIEITKLFLNMVREKLEERGIDFEAKKEAVEELAVAGFDPLYGARPLKRAVQERVEDKVARLFLEDKIKRRDKLTLKKGLVFEIEKAPEI